MIYYTHTHTHTHTHIYIYIYKICISYVHILMKIYTKLMIFKVLKMVLDIFYHYFKKKKNLSKTPLIDNE